MKDSSPVWAVTSLDQTYSERNANTIQIHGTHKNAIIVQQKGEEMKVERWEEETDEEWAERLTEETEIANNTETAQYFVERDSYDEDKFIINYIKEDSWTWKEHPEGPFSCKQVLDWKKKAELYDEEAPILKEIIADKQTLVDDMTDKLRAIKDYIPHLMANPEVMMKGSSIAEILEKLL